MGTFTILALRVVLAIVFAGSLLVQTVMVPLLAADLEQLSAQYLYLRIPVLAIIVIAFITVEVCCVCVWRLASMVKRKTVFSPGAFRFVDAIIAAIAVGALDTFALGVLLAPGEAVPPGGVLLIGGAGILVCGVALIVLVLRLLLAQAVARDAEARSLEAELGEVI
jgi:hypothetical protein